MALENQKSKHLYCHHSHSTGHQTHVCMNVTVLYFVTVIYCVPCILSHSHSTGHQTPGILARAQACLWAGGEGTTRCPSRGPHLGAAGTCSATAASAAADVVGCTSEERHMEGGQARHEIWGAAGTCSATAASAAADVVGCTSEV